MKKITSLILALVLAFSLVSLSACGDKATDDKNSDSADDKVITVGASATPHAEILEQVKQALADEGYELKIVTYDDYVLPNQALADGTAAQTYANIIAVRSGDENSPKTQALLKALKTDAVKQYIADTYNGAVVASF